MPVVFDFYQASWNFHQKCGRNTRLRRFATFYNGMSSHMKYEKLTILPQF